MGFAQAFQSPRSSSVFPLSKAQKNHFRYFASSYGENMDQHDLMETDCLIAVDEKDNCILQDITKKQGHEFTKATPRGILHRAFSLFVFDDQNRMLLTQRASSKITFPNVWTNTCCSHPLQHMPQNEVDNPLVDYPQFPGIKTAAVRKMKHELGMDLSSYLNEIQFLTRFHYWATDTITYGTKKDPTWGEHEVDYILFVKTRGQLPMDVNPEEVQNYKYVSVDELRQMTEEPDLLWSPWFRGIMDRGGWEWCANVDDSLSGTYTNSDIVYFDPPAEHVAAFNEPTHSRLTGVLQ